MRIRMLAVGGVVPNPSSSGQGGLMAGVREMSRRFEKLTAIIGLVPALLVVSACGTWTGSGYVPDRIGRVEIVQPVTIPANRARATFQGGRQVSGGYPYNPYCELEISTVSEQPQRVETDVFVVTRSGSALISDADARLPIAGPFVNVTCGDLIFYEVEHWLASDRQPGVRKIRCLQGFNACWGGAVHPGRDVIAATLGKAFVVE